MSIVPHLQHQCFLNLVRTYITRIDISTGQENKLQRQGIQTMLQHSNKTKQNQLHMCMCMCMCNEGESKKNVQVKWCLKKI